MEEVLNAKQLEAVTHENNPLLIVADPESGKTHVFIERILHLIKKSLQ